jgi:hypothetical protein
MVFRKEVSLIEQICLSSAASGSTGIEATTPETRISWSQQVHLENSHHRSAGHADDNHEEPARDDSEAVDDVA